MTSYSETGDLLARLSAAVNRDHRRRRRRRIALLVLAALVLSTATVATATQGPWWENAPPPVNPQVVDRQLAPTLRESFPPTADRSRARTVAELDGAALVAAPVAKDGYCLIPSLPGSPDIGFSCEYQLTDEVRSYARPAGKGNARWILYGRLTSPQAATLDLSEAAGTSLRVRLQPGGFFIVDVPPERWSALANGAGPATVQDSSGARIATVCIAWGPSPASSAAGETRTPSPLNVPPCRAPVQITIKPMLDQAQKLVQVELTDDFSIWKAGTTLALWQAPDAGGGWCTLLAPVPLPTAREALGGMACGESSRIISREHPISTRVSSARAHGEYEHLIAGSVDVTSGIVRVQIQSSGVVRDLALDHGSFLGQLASTDSPDLNGFVVGYDAAGNEVARVSLVPRH